MIGWRKYKNLSAAFTPWTAMCCDALEHYQQTKGDMVLSTLVRLSSIASEASEAIHDCRERTGQQTRLLLLGLETQAHDLQQRLPSHIAATSESGNYLTIYFLTDRPPAPVRFALVFIDFYPNAGSLIATPRSRSSSSAWFLPPTASKLTSILPALALFLSEMLHLDPSAFSCFTAVDWSRLIVAIILSFRLSLPVPECPTFDHLSARACLRLDDFLDTMCCETEIAPTVSSTGSNTKVDALSASRVVLRVVKTKFDRRVDLANMRDAATSVAGHGCPMLDGSLDQYFPLWDAGLSAVGTTTTTTTTTPAATTGGNKPVFHDLWATMTMGWAEGSDQ